MPGTADRTADAVVIGGVIVGVATAFWLSKAGLETILVEIRDGLSKLTTAASILAFKLLILVVKEFKIYKRALTIIAAYYINAI